MRLRRRQKTTKKVIKKRIKRIALDKKSIYNIFQNPFRKKFAVTFNITPMSKVVTGISLIKISNIKDEPIPLITYVHSCYLTDKRAKRELEEIYETFLNKKVKFQ